MSMRIFGGLRVHFSKESIWSRRLSSLHVGIVGSLVSSMDLLRYRHLKGFLCFIRHESVVIVCFFGQSTDFIIENHRLYLLTRKGLHYNILQTMMEEWWRQTNVGRMRWIRLCWIVAKIVRSILRFQWILEHRARRVCTQRVCIEKIFKLDALFSHRHAFCSLTLYYFRLADVISSIW